MKISTAKPVRPADIQTIFQAMAFVGQRLGRTINVRYNPSGFFTADSGTHYKFCSEDPAEAAGKMLKKLVLTNQKEFPDIDSQDWTAPDACEPCSFMITRMASTPCFPAPFILSWHNHEHG